MKGKRVCMGFINFVYEYRILQSYWLQTSNLALAFVCHSLPDFCQANLEWLNLCESVPWTMWEYVQFHSTPTLHLNLIWIQLFSHQNNLLQLMVNFINLIDLDFMFKIIGRFDFDFLHILLFINCTLHSLNNSYFVTYYNNYSFHHYNHFAPFRLIYIIEAYS